jgi:hypothetical protein
VKKGQSSMNMMFCLHNIKGYSNNLCSSFLIDRDRTMCMFSMWFTNRFCTNITFYFVKCLGNLFNWHGMTPCIFIDSISSCVFLIALWHWPTFQGEWQHVTHLHLNSAFVTLNINSSLSSVEAHCYSAQCKSFLSEVYPFFVTYNENCSNEQAFEICYMLPISDSCCFLMFQERQAAEGATHTWSVYIIKTDCRVKTVWL